MAVAGLKKAILRTGFEALYFSGSHVWLRPFVGGIGSILTLHHVRPPRRDAFQPNRLLEVTPAFLEAVIVRLRRAGVDLVSLDEMHRRMTERDFARRFVAITFDDGYRDTMQWAYPILKEAQVPFAIYVPTSFPDRLGELWWLALEAVIARNEHIGLQVAGRTASAASMIERLRSISERTASGESFASIGWLTVWAPMVTSGSAASVASSGQVMHSSSQNLAIST